VASTAPVAPLAGGGEEVGGARRARRANKREDKRDRRGCCGRGLGWAGEGGAEERERDRSVFWPGCKRAQTRAPVRPLVNSASPCPAPLPAAPGEGPSAPPKPAPAHDSPLPSPLPPVRTCLLHTAQAPAATTV
jgi:hypothetical protein